MMKRLLTPIALLLMLATTALAETPSIQILFFTGTVTVEDGGTQYAAYIGQELDSTASVKVGRGARLQLSLNGRLLEIKRPTTLKLAPLYRKLDSVGNRVVVRSLRLLGNSPAISPDSTLAALAGREGSLLATLDGRASGKAAPARPLPYPIATTFERDNRLVILEPRATAVTRGPLRFRWMKTHDPSTFVVTVRDRRGEEIFRGETSDSTLVWEGADLRPGNSYSWTLTRREDTNATLTARFTRLDDLKVMQLEAGESQLRIELGNKNPALPLLLGAHLSQMGCHGEAARWFTLAAQRTPEHAARFMALAIDEYRTSAGLADDEIEMLYALGCD